MIGDNCFGCHCVCLRKVIWGGNCFGYTCIGPRKVIGVQLFRIHLHRRPKSDRGLIVYGARQIVPSQLEPSQLLPKNSHRELVPPQLVPGNSRRLNSYRETRTVSTRTDPLQITPSLKFTVEIIHRTLQSKLPNQKKGPLYTTGVI